jgi:hypothetical protein
MRNFLSRRDFNLLTSAAFGGMVAGTMFGCSSQKNEKNAGGGHAGAVVAVAAGVHACRGLNDCKAEGADKQNACAGQGSCAAVKHDCATQNDCKRQGGCGEAPGYNDCKTKGGCAVPMSAGMWEKARARFEQQMKSEGKQFGAAPAAKTG